MEERRSRERTIPSARRRHKVATSCSLSKLALSDTNQRVSKIGGKRGKLGTRVRCGRNTEFPLLHLSSGAGKQRPNRCVVRLVLPAYIRFGCSSCFGSWLAVRGLFFTRAASSTAGHCDRHFLSGLGNLDAPKEASVLQDLQEKNRQGLLMTYLTHPKNLDICCRERLIIHLSIFSEEEVNPMCVIWARMGDTAPMDAESNGAKKHE